MVGVSKCLLSPHLALVLHGWFQFPSTLLGALDSETGSLTGVPLKEDSGWKQAPGESPNSTFVAALSLAPGKLSLLDLGLSCFIKGRDDGCVLGWSLSVYRR